MNKLLLITLTLVTCQIRLAAFNISHGRWNLNFDETSKLMSISYDNRMLFTGVYGSVGYYFADDNSGAYWPETKDAAAWTLTRTDGYSDSFGTGTKYSILYTFNWPNYSGDGSQLVQDFVFYNDVDYFVCQLTVANTSGREIKTNYVLPLRSSSEATFMNGSYNGENRMLWIPWDNDEYVKYQSRAMNTTHESNSVIALFNGTTRKGLVMGAIDHNQWKNCAKVTASNNYKVDYFELRSGYTSVFTHDQGMAHGMVRGQSVSSARFMVGWFDDWRTGMETYGRACARVEPRWEWNGAKPVGWNSWGVLQTNLQYEYQDHCVLNTAKYIANELMPRGFHDANGQVVFDLDSWWDFLSDSDRNAVFDYCRQHNMIPGLYYGPWVDWISEGDLDSNFYGTYKHSDVCLKQNGNYKTLDGAYCLDPTHPAVIAKMEERLQQFYSYGIGYVKVDFLSQGAIEADSWYDTSVHTGMEAYNQGMNRFKQKILDLWGDGGLYVDLSIAPLFPHQYGHSRRISCDVFRSISDTQYCLNGTSFGWWLDQCYYAQDPDQLVMVDKNGAYSPAETRARLTSGLVTGIFLMGDNFSGTNYGNSNTTQSRNYAQNFLANNTDLMHAVHTCRAFHPAFGHWAGESGAENIFVYETSQYVYVACLNYKSSSFFNSNTANWNIDVFYHIGIDRSNVAEIKELWSGTMVSLNSDGKFIATVPAKDARIYRIKKVNGIDDTPSYVLSQNKDVVDRQTEIQAVSTRGDSQFTDVYTLDGRRLTIDGKKPQSGIYIVNGKKVKY